MTDYRKYACDLSGSLFKEVNKKGIRRDRLAKELGISENQIKNYAYDSTKSATLENFLQVMINHRCVDVLAKISSEMGYAVYKLPETNGKINTPESAADALSAVSSAITSCLNKENRDIEKEIRIAIEKLLTLSASVKTGN